MISPCQSNDNLRPSSCLARRLELFLTPTSLRLITSNLEIVLALLSKYIQKPIVADTVLPASSKPPLPDLYRCQRYPPSWPPPLLYLVGWEHRGHHVAFCKPDLATSLPDLHFPQRRSPGVYSCLKCPWTSGSRHSLIFPIFSS